jgi:hypothetical protein
MPINLYTSIYQSRYQPTKLFLILLLLAAGLCPVAAQDTTQKLTFWDVPDSLHRGRFWTAAGTGTVAYTGTLLTLNNLWYTKYPRTSFHLFDDSREWQQMDKAGHMFTAYFEADWLYHIARWTGMREKSSIWAGALMATSLQATVETLDGFSSQWGFSLSDFGSNIAGGLLWASQQAGWKEQRIRMKVSSTYRTYPAFPVYSNIPDGMTTLDARAKDLFGKNILQSFLKDYNAQTIWLSFNVHSFLKEESKFPKWLNVAAGYGAENMFGGFENKWKEDDGSEYVLNENQFPRYSQYYISPDIDLSKIKTKSKFVNTLFCMLNIFKIPAPALEINGKGGVDVEWIHY